MTEPKRDEAMVIAEKLIDFAAANGGSFSIEGKKRVIADFAAQIRPHLAPQPVVPEEIEWSAKDLELIATQSLGPGLHRDLTVRAAAKLRALAGENAELKVTIAQIQQNEKDFTARVHAWNTRNRHGEQPE